MKNKAKQIGEVSLLFGVGLASHCLGNTPESSGVIASALGLSTHVAQGIFTLGSHVLAHGVYESIIKAKESFTGDLNNDLETAILNAYKESLAQIEKDIIDEYQVKEKLSGKLMRYVFNKTNKEYDDLSELKESFLTPLQEALTSDKIIEEMLQQNMQLSPDEFLKKIIEKATPEFAEKDNNLFVEFIDKVCEKFKRYFKHYFLQELKSDDRAKTVYFAHLLELIVLNTKDIDKKISIIQDFAAQANRKLSDIFKNINDVNGNWEIIRKLDKENQETISKKLESIQVSIREFLSPVLDKRNRAQYQDQFNKYDFKYEYLNFVGRNNELNELLDFVGTRDDEMKFLWWMILGPGGMGKSRLAQKLCKLAYGYYAGFLDLKTNIKWESWRPEVPTLIIIDYALSRTNQVVDIITTISQRSMTYSYPVRLLLLDRQETQEWIEKRRPGTELYDTLYRTKMNSSGAMLNLSPLDEYYSWNLIEQVIQRENASKWDLINAEKEEILRKINELNDKHRPLFTFLIAVALASGDNIRNWNINDLLKNSFIRLEEVWLKYIDKELINDIELILLINTFCGELEKNNINDLIKEFNIPIEYGDFIKAYSFMSENTINENNEVWYGLQPDILGEYFILKVIDGMNKRMPGEGNKLTSKLLYRSWNINFRNTITFSYMIWTDFVFGKVDKKINFDINSTLFEQISICGNQVIKTYLAALFTNTCAKKLESELTQDAEDEADLAIQLDSLQPFSYNNRGVCRTDLGKFQLAMEDFDKGMELDKLSPTLYYNIGRLKRIMKKYEEAIMYFNKSIELEPYLGYAYNDRGLTKYNLGLFKESIDDLDVAIKLSHGYISYCNRGVSKNALGMHDEAILDFNMAISINGKDALSYFNRGLAKRDLAELNDDIIYLGSAMSDFNKAIELNGSDADFYTMRGDTLYGLGMKEQACQDFKTAIQLGNLLARDLYQERCNSQKRKQFKRNDRVTVRYPDGKIKSDVKYKNVQEDVESGLCIITDHS